MKIVAQVFITILILSLSSCNSSKIEGLWLVEEVRVDDQEITPDARWIHFGADNAQESGNGWLMHSQGSYSFQDETKLSINDENGYKDDYEPFTVQLFKDSMIWKRMEDGRQVELKLSRIMRVPPSNANKLIGLWDLVEVLDEGLDKTSEHDPNNKRYLHFRWDQVFVEDFCPEGKMSGIYRSNAHKKEVELIYSGTDQERIWLGFETMEDKLILVQQIADRKLIKTYQRINEFPID